MLAISHRRSRAGGLPMGIQIAFSYISLIGRMVGARRFELLTPWAQGRAAKLRCGPTGANVNFVLSAHYIRKLHFRAQIVLNALGSWQYKVCSRRQSSRYTRGTPCSVRHGRYMAR